MSKVLLFSNIVLVRSLFLWTFCENTFRDFKIIVLPHPQISKLNWLWLLTMPISVKSVFSEWTVITVHLLFTLVVNIFKQVSTGFPFFCFKPWRIHLEVGFATSHYFSIMFKFVWIIVFLTFWFMHAIHIHSVIPLPTVLALWNTKVHICSSYGSNMMAYIEISVKKALCFYTIL